MGDSIRLQAPDPMPIFYGVWRCYSPRAHPLSPAGPLGLRGSAGGKWGYLGPRILPKVLHSPHLLSGSSVSLHSTPKEVQRLYCQGTQGRACGVRGPGAWAGEERVLAKQLEKAEVSHQ